MAQKRRKGTGTCRKRSDGRWEGRIIVSYDENNKPKIKSVTAKTKTECLQKLNELKEEAGFQDRRKQVELSHDMLFSDWLIFWYENYSKPKLRKSTQNLYENRIYKHLIPGLGSIPLNEIEEKDIQKFYKKMKNSGRLKDVKARSKSLSDSSVRGCGITCKAALQGAVNNGLLNKNPAEECKLPSKKSKEMQILTKEEMQRLLIQARFEEYYELFLLEISTGMRIGELAGLQWKDLNFNTGELKIRRQVSREKGKLVVSEPKTKSSIRTLILSPSVLNVLKAYKKGKKSKWIFASPINENEPLAITTCRKRLHLILERAGCKDVRFHDLRHTFATTALEYGIDIKTLSATLGHITSDTTLDVYSHVTDTMQKEAARSIDVAIGKAEDIEEDTTSETQKKMPKPKFEANEGNRRRNGKGCVTKISEQTWEGRYSPKYPDGKRHSSCVYAHTKEECETKLAEIIDQVNKELKKLNSKPIENYDYKPKFDAGEKISKYLKKHKGETNKSLIAREVGVSRNTVQRYFKSLE